MAFSNVSSWPFGTPERENTAVQSEKANINYLSPFNQAFLIRTQRRIISLIERDRHGPEMLCQRDYYQ